jgi:hypothetical protein
LRVAMHDNRNNHGLVQPRRHAIGRWPDFPISHNGPVEGRLLGPAAVVDPSSDAAGGRLIPNPAPDFGFVETLQTVSKGGGGVRGTGMGSE